MNRLAFPVITTALVLGFNASAVIAHEPSQIELHKQAKVSEAAAKKTALAKVPDGTVSSSELEREHGKLIWSFDIAQAGSKNVTEIQVDAKNGKIVSTTIETASKEAAEAAAEAKEKVK
jgi:hypothetical protein